jgi:hypothetical protein
LAWLRRKGAALEPLLALAASLGIDEAGLRCF